MELKNGGLYETKHGARFRVSTEVGLFVCSSFGGHWSKDGRASGKMWVNGDYRRPHLVREVDECRWVPASHKKWASTPNHLRCADGRHHQVLVDREMARAIGRDGHEKAMLKRVAASYSVPTAAAPERIKTAIIKHGVKSFVEVTMPDGRAVLIEM